MDILNAFLRGAPLHAAGLFQTLTDANAIAYRQAAVRDGLLHPEETCALYHLAAETLEKKKSMWHWLSVRRDIAGIYTDAVALLKYYIGMLRRLRRLADVADERYQSEAFRAFWRMLRRDLSDDYLDGAATLIAELASDGMLVSARFGDDLGGTGYALSRKNRGHYRLRWGIAPRYRLALRPGTMREPPSFSGDVSAPWTRAPTRWPRQRSTSRRFSTRSCARLRFLWVAGTLRIDLKSRG